LILRSPFKVVAVEAYAQEAPLLKLFPFLKKMPAVYEYLRGSAAFRLVKPVPGSSLAEKPSSGT
jgi:hypothetical protein